MTESIGVTSIESSSAAVTVKRVSPEMPSKVAVMIVLHASWFGPEVIAKPFVPLILEIKATLLSEETQVTSSVIFWVVPFE